VLIWVLPDEAWVWIPTWEHFRTQVSPLLIHLVLELTLLLICISHSTWMLLLGFNSYVNYRDHVYTNWHTGYGRGGGSWVIPVGNPVRIWAYHPKWDQVYANRVRHWYGDIWYDCYGPFMWPHAWYLSWGNPPPLVPFGCSLFAVYKSRYTHNIS
jgi:hypothetical protein